MKTTFIPRTACLALVVALLFTLMPQSIVATEVPAVEEEVSACEASVSEQKTDAACIVQQPADAAAVLGDKVSVSVEATGKGLKYYWYYRDTSAKNFSKSSITGNTYVLTMTEARANREVYCVITDTYGNRIQTDTATLLLAVKDELEIIQQPVPDDALPGEFATVFVEAKGDALKYQWYYRDAGAKTFTKSSIKESVYTVSVTDARANREVYCVVSDAHGNQVQTDTVTLVHVEELAITRQPVSGSAVLGETASVSVEASGYPLKYTWYYRDASAKNFSKSSITASTYALTMTEERANREVYCVITDAHGNQVQTDTVQLLLAVKDELEIVQQPVSDDALPGESATVFVEAKGDALKYQWYYRDAGAKTFTKSSIKESSYTVTVTDARANREVYCVVSDAHGNQVQTDTVTLIHVEELAITRQPVSGSAALGETVSVSVEASGYPLKYTWYYRDAKARNFSKSSITTSTYALTMTEARVNREVYCVVKDAHGNTVTSDVVTLMLKTEPEVETTYYTNLNDALAGMGGSAEQAGASVAVEIAADEINVVLLQDIDLTEMVVIDSDITLNLNGYQIVSAAEEAIIVRADAVIDGTVSGSGMTAIAAAQQKATLIHLESGSLTVNGGAYETITTNAGTSTNQAAAVIAESGTVLTICGAEITAEDTADGSVVGVMGKADSVLEAEDSTVIVSSGTGLENVSVHTKGDAKLTNCTVIAEANYTANAAGTAYASNSRGIYAEGSLEMYDCYVWGSHAGVTAKGAVYVDGGTYEGYGHGGIYFSGAGTSSYIYNAELNWAEMREGTIADKVAGTNGAGVYIGGASNVNVYMDNCKVYGTLYGVVLRRSGGEKYNNVYVSNSVVEGSRCAFRIQKASATTLLVHSGVGNTFSSPSIDFPANLLTTGESYAKP